MRHWWLALLLAFSPFDGFQRIAHRNQNAQEANAAFQRQDYQLAAVLFERVRQAEGESTPPSVQVNLAHSYFHLRDFSRASPLYRALLRSPDPSMLSMVATQLSVIEAEEGNFTKALSYSKQAMIADETNQAARYNYELLQKYLLLHPEKRQSPPPPQRQNLQKGQGGSSPQPNPAGSSSAQRQTPGSADNQQQSPNNGTTEQPGNGGKEQEQPVGTSPGQTRGQQLDGAGQGNGTPGNQRSREPGQVNDAYLQTRFERLKKLQLSPEKARQLLDAMKQEETQYLQQVPRKKAKTTNDGKPDW